MEIKYIEWFPENQTKRSQLYIKVVLTSGEREALEETIELILKTGSPEIINNVQVSSMLINNSAKLEKCMQLLDLEINMLIPTQSLDDRYKGDRIYKANRNRIIQMGDKFLWEIGVEKLEQIGKAFKRAENIYEALGNIPNYDFDTHLERFVDFSVNDRVVETYFTIV